MASGDVWVGSGEPLYVIAEAGVNHENDLGVASSAYWDRDKEPAAPVP